MKHGVPLWCSGIGSKPRHHRQRPIAGRHGVSGLAHYVKRIGEFGGIRICGCLRNGTTACRGHKTGSRRFFQLSRNRLNHRKRPLDVRFLHSGAVLRHRLLLCTARIGGIPRNGCRNEVTSLIGVRSPVGGRGHIKPYATLASVKGGFPDELPKIAL